MNSELLTLASAAIVGIYQQGDPEVRRNQVLSELLTRARCCTAVELVGRSFLRDAVDGSYVRFQICMDADGVELDFSHGTRGKHWQSDIDRQITRVDNSRWWIFYPGKRFAKNGVLEANTRAESIDLQIALHLGLTWPLCCPVTPPRVWGRSVNLIEILESAEYRACWDGGHLVLSDGMQDRIVLDASRRFAMKDREIVAADGATLRLKIESWRRVEDYWSPATARQEVWRDRRLGAVVHVCIDEVNATGYNLRKHNWRELAPGTLLLADNAEEWQQVAPGGFVVMEQAIEACKLVRARSWTSWMLGSAACLAMVAAACCGWFWPRRISP